MAKQNAKKAVETKVVTFPKTEANRTARLERHLRKHPNDIQAGRATSTKERRQKPKVKGSTSAFVSKIEWTGAATNAELKEIAKATQLQFGKVRPNIFGVEYTRDNVRALCYGVGIKFTGNANKPRTQKRKVK